MNRSGLVLFVFLASLCSATFNSCGFETDGGAGGSCSVAEATDGSGVVLTCPDGTSVTIDDGANGARGFRGFTGKGCHVEDIDVLASPGARSGVMIVCDDGTSVSLLDGHDGQDARPLSCYTVEDGKGCAEFFCTDSSDYTEPLYVFCPPTPTTVCDTEVAEGCLWVACGDGVAVEMWCVGDPTTTNPNADITDSDSDGIVDAVDNCPIAPNHDQSDKDSDGLGDACDMGDNNTIGDVDSDDDGWVDAVDNCPIIWQENQFDWDGNGVGNVCDDWDGDGIVDAVDNCLRVFNATQTDTDGDGRGDACESEMSCVSDSDCGVGLYCQSNGICLSADPSVDPPTTAHMVTLTMATGWNIWGAVGAPSTAPLGTGWPVGEWAPLGSSITWDQESQVAAFNAYRMVGEQPKWAVGATSQDATGAWCVSPQLFADVSVMFVGTVPASLNCTIRCANETQGDLNWLCSIPSQ